MKVLVLASGKGTRVQNLSNGLNKALIPVGNKATLSYIIEKFPKGSHIYVTLGYLGEQVRDFCLLAYPDYEFTFIPVPDYEGPGSGPGKSALYAEPYLQKPFYLCLCDCIVEEEIDFEDQNNWIGVQPTNQPEIYSTALTRSGQVLDFKNKDKAGYPDAFIGLAHIQTPQIFWKELKDRMISGELVEVFKSYEKLNLKARFFTWFDTGNPESLQKTRNSLCIEKNTGENLYHEGSRCIKYFPDPEKVQELFVRGKLLDEKAPKNLEIRGNFIAYDWLEGTNLYNVEDRIKIATDSLWNAYRTSKLEIIPEQCSADFYLHKLYDRVTEFVNRYGEKYLKEQFFINGEPYCSMGKLLSEVPWNDIYGKVKPFQKFHGDFQPSNLVLSDDKLYYIDWRNNYGGFLGGGDLYYELGKFLGGLEVNYDKAKDDTYVDFKESGVDVSFRTFSAETEKLQFRKEVETRGYEWSHVELIRCLVQLSMCPLHTEKFGKYLWFKTIVNLTEWVNRKLSL